MKPNLFFFFAKEKEYCTIQFVICESLTTGRLVASSLHVNLEKLAGANYTSLIGMKRVSKIKGFGTEDAGALAQQNANERLGFARNAIRGS